MPPVGCPHLLAPPVGGCAPNGGISAATSSTCQFPIAPESTPGPCLGRDVQPHEYRGAGRGTRRGIPQPPVGACRLSAGERDRAVPSSCRERPRAELAARKSAV